MTAPDYGITWWVETLKDVKRCSTLCTVIEKEQRLANVFSMLRRFSLVPKSACPTNNAQLTVGLQCSFQGLSWCRLMIQAVDTGRCVRLQSICDSRLVQSSAASACFCILQWMCMHVYFSSWNIRQAEYVWPRHIGHGQCGPRSLQSSAWQTLPAPLQRSQGHSGKYREGKPGTRLLISWFCMILPGLGTSIGWKLGKVKGQIGRTKTQQMSIWFLFFFIFANKTPAPTSSSPQKSNLMAIRQHRRMEARPKNIMTCNKMHNASIMQARFYKRPYQRA